MSIVKVQTSKEVITVSVAEISGAKTVGDLREYLQDRYPGSTITLKGQRVTLFNYYEPLNHFWKRVTNKDSSAVFIVDTRDSSWDATIPESFDLLALTEKETPLADSAELSYYASGLASYTFEVNELDTVDPKQFEMYIVLSGEGDRLLLTVSADWTIRKIKSEVQHSLGIPTYIQRLFSKLSSGDLLPDYKTVMDCGFGPGSLLELTFNTKSGWKQPQPADFNSDVIVMVISRPFDVKVKLPTRKVVKLTCDQHDYSRTVKMRIAALLNPELAKYNQTVTTAEVETEPLQDDDSKLPGVGPCFSPEDCLLELPEDQSNSQLSPEELLAALKSSQEQCKKLQDELNAKKKHIQVRGKLPSNLKPA